MRVGGCILFWALTLGPAYSLDHRPEQNKSGQRPKPQNAKKAEAAQAPRDNSDAEARISRMESRMVRRDREMDRRMKTPRR